MHPSREEDSFWSGRSRGARWLSFSVITISFGLFTVVASAASRDNAWPATALGILAVLALGVCVLAWAYRGTVEGRGDGLFAWLDGVPRWVGLALAVIGFGWVGVGSYGYFAQGREFGAVVQYNVVGFGTMAFAQLLPRIRWRVSRTEQRRV